MLKSREISVPYRDNPVLENLGPPPPDRPCFANFGTPPDGQISGPPSVKMCVHSYAFACFFLDVSNSDMLCVHYCAVKGGILN